MSFAEIAASRALEAISSGTAYFGNDGYVFEGFLDPERTLGFLAYNAKAAGRLEILRR